MKYLIILSLLLFASVAYSQTSCDACAGSINKTLTVNGGNAPTGYTATFSWDNGVTSTTNTATVTSAGVYTVTVTWTDNASLCPSVVNTHTFTVTATNPPVCAVNATPVCVGGDLTLGSTATLGTAPYTYAWTGPNGFTSTAEIPVISNVGTSASGTYTLVVTDSNGCESAACSVSVTVGAAPTMTLTGTCN